MLKCMGGNFAANKIGVSDWHQIPQTKRKVTSNGRSIVFNLRRRQVIPPTRNGIPAMACVSAMQKCIRRAMEVEAMQFAVELIHTSKAQCSMVANRLMVISHEDIDTATQPHIVPFVATAAAQAKEWYEAENPSKSRLALGNAIRMLCRATKSREGDHFQASLGLASMIDGFVPAVPDFALDMHTMQGKQKGRGIEHFIEEGCKLEPQPQPDVYRDSAIALWKKKLSEK